MTYSRSLQKKNPAILTKQSGKRATSRTKVAHIIKDCYCRLRSGGQADDEDVYKTASMPCSTSWHTTIRQTPSAMAPWYGLDTSAKPIMEASRAQTFPGALEQMGSGGPLQGGAWLERKLEKSGMVPVMLSIQTPNSRICTWNLW